MLHQMGGPKSILSCVDASLPQQACPSLLDCSSLGSMHLSTKSYFHMALTVSFLVFWLINLLIVLPRTSTWPPFFPECLALHFICINFPSTCSCSQGQEHNEDVQLPEKIEITWNKTMLQSAGLHTTNEIQQPKRECYAKTAISLKVCDSAGDSRNMGALP